MSKLDESKVRWIIRQKKTGSMTNRQIADTMKISTIWVKKLWARYRHTHISDMIYPMPMGRPTTGLSGRREHSAVLSAHCKHNLGAVRAEARIKDDTGIHIPHNTIQKVLKSNDLAEKHPKKTGQRKYVRYERDYSNSM